MTPTALRSAALVVLTFAAPALAQSNPYDREQQELARQAARDRGPRGTIALYELWRNWGEATPAVTRTELERLYRNRRLAADRRGLAGAFLARAYLRAGRTYEANEVLQQLGSVTSWQIAAPFDNEGKQGFARAFGPETEGFDVTSTWPGKERDVGWRGYPDITRIGYVNFDAVARPTSNVCGYAQTVVQSGRAQPLTLWFGGGGASKIWWNGEEVFADDVYRSPDPDRQAIAVGAHAGANRLLVKTCATDGTWGFYLRVTGSRGAALDNVNAGVEGIPNSFPEGHGVTPGRAPETTLTRLEAAASSPRASGRTLYDLARFLMVSSSDDPNENRARQLAARAAEESPVFEHLELAARLQEQRSETMRWMHRALERYPREPKAWLLEAQVRRSGLHPEEALPLLERIENEATGIVRIEARMLRAELYQQMDLPRAARRLVEEAAAEAASAHGFTLARARYAEAAGDHDASVRLRSEALGLRHNDVSSRRNLIADGVRRRDRAGVFQHLEDLADIRPSANNLRYIAAIYEAIGETDAAQAIFVSARRIAPEDASTIVAHGQLMLRLQQSDAAIEAFRAALRIRPQDAETRELLEQIQPQERPDERYAVGTEELLQRTREQQGYPLTTLQDLTVNTVYDNGLGSAFRQVAVQVHDDEGARQMRTYSIQFDPGSQRVDVRLARIHRGGQELEATQYFEQQLGEPWYRIYYDTRALVVVFPDLEAGDVVELRWRVDDVAHRNVFADYYGDLTFLQSFSPTVNKEYVLITPARRQFYFNEPSLQGLEHDRREENGLRIDRYRATDVPAIRSEPGMPGFTEISPYLHVSTYQTWEDVGRWYWGLIQDQLYADESLQRTVAELIRGKESERDRVVAIHDWVVEHTRYVGLEFGIHGYKPYRVPQIVSRGFGDCKDKASLLYTMFREAGIDAHVVLVRTRRNGNINDLPASLAVFDHAIAYVPGLNLYIDGTAEHSGVTELPTMDQGVTVLHVWPEGSELRRTPVLPPDQNRRERNLDVRLARDGSAEVRGRESVRGTEAPGYRSTYQAEGTRAERFERRLRNYFPGLRLESQEFENLDDLEAPVVYEYRAEVPQLAQRDGDMLRSAPTVMSDLTRTLARAPSRNYPLDLGGTTSYVEERTTRMPGGTSVRQAPEGGTAESPFGRLRMTVEASGRQVMTRTEFELRRDRIEPNEYGAFRRWVEEVDQILRQRLILEGAQ
ncbi:MAG: DUF3857 domain-containing protein [Myxococcota bacterium]